MALLSLRTGTLIVVSGILALGTVGCGSDRVVIPKSEAVESLLLSAAPTPSPSPQPSASPQAPTGSEMYQQATDTAAGATLLSEAALVRQDWSLVANQWQESIRLLKAVPTYSKQYPAAQKKLKEFQNHLAIAKAKAAPPPKKSCSGDTNPQFFFAPIRGRIGGIPIIEVTFHDGHKFDMMVDTGASYTLLTKSMAATLQLPLVGLESATIADGSNVTIPTGLLKFAEIDGRLMRDVPVGVAPSAMQMGLLGQDFFKGYDLNIKESVIEFRRQPGFTARKNATSSSKTCLVDTKPQFFSVPIKRRESGLPVVTVAFNNSHTFDMVFDTGATRTLVTRSMAAELDLPLVGTKPVKIADGSVVTLPTALVKSEKIAGRIKTDVVVWVAPPAMGIGLLGQDFFEGYNVTVKKNSIEFRRQRYSS